MNLEKDKVGLIHYTLKDDAGAVLDSSEGGEPLGFIFGNGNLIPGMEKALEGKKAGDKFDVTINPEDAYGTRREDLIHVVPKANFSDQDKVKVGVQFQANTQEGPRIATVIKIDGEDVTVDFNHPLADKKLFFNVEVVEVREPTAEELANGHVCSSGCGPDCDDESKNE